MRSRLGLVAVGIALLLASAAVALAAVSLARSDTAAGSPAAASAGDSPTIDNQLGTGGGMGMGGGAMADHMAPVSSEGVTDATEDTGGSVLEPRIENGVWVYELETRPVLWRILPDVKVTAYTYNGTVPGPELRIPYGQRVRIVVRNELPDPTTVHWHGLAVPNAMDGVPGVTQDPIPSGGMFTYEFAAIPAGRDSQGGTFFYHSHFEEDRQVSLGLSGALIVEPPSPVRSTSSAPS